MYLDKVIMRIHLTIVSIFFYQFFCLVAFSLLLPSSFALGPQVLDWWVARQAMNRYQTK